jgi:hypothetical protein
MNKRHVITGFVCWLLALAVGRHFLRAELEQQSSSLPQLSSGVLKWVSGERGTMSAASTATISVGLDDPIFLQDPDGSFRQVGMAVDINGQTTRNPTLTRQFEVVIYDDARSAFADGFELHYHTSPMSLDWVVKTMIPPERQREIAAYIASEWQLQQAQLVAELKPVVREGLKTAARAIEAELPGILRSYRSELNELGDRFETEILKEEIVPLVQEEILPIIEEEATPVAEEVVRALWKKVSLFSFAWRFLADKSPLPKKDRVKAEFQRFVEEEVVPELESRTDQFIAVTENIVRRSLENPRVKSVLRENLKRVIEDDELQNLLRRIVREAIVENQTLRTSVEAYLNNQQTKAVMKLAGARLEPMVRHIGDLIFGTRERGITPEFSRILRSQILKKDRRWFVMVPRSDVAADDLPDDAAKNAIPVVPAPSAMIYPMGFGGNQQSPLTPEAP